MNEKPYRFAFMSKKNILTFLLILVWGIVWADTGEVNLTITVQPYEKDKTSIMFNGTPITFSVIQHDKTLARLRTHVYMPPLNVCGERYPYTLTVAHPEFETKVFHVPMNQKELKLYAVLDKPNSVLQFQTMFPTDGTPKSVRFIDNETIAVTLLSGRGFNVINLRSGECRLISPPEKYAKQEGFVESLLLKHKNELWISQMSTDCIHVFSLPSFDYVRSIQCSGNWGKVLAYCQRDNTVYFSNWISNDISIVDVEHAVEKKRQSVGAVPRGIVFSDDENFAYFAQFESPDGSYGGKTIKVRLSDFTVTAKLGKPGAKRHLVKDSERQLLYVSDMSRCIVEVFSMRNDRKVAEIPVGDNPNTIVLSGDGKRLFVSCRGKNHPTKGYLYKGLVFGRLYTIDTDTFTVTESIEGGNQPTGLDISPDGTTLVFSDFLDNTVRVYRIKQ